jgi:hypothetical protein
MGKALSSVFLVSASSGWVAVYNCNPEQKNTLEPIVTLVQSKTTVYIEENIVSAMDVVTVITKKGGSI